jgi:PAS domain S-box-containing protein
MDEQTIKSVFTAIESLSSEGIAVLDSEGNYIYLNPIHAGIYGYTKEELYGKTWKTLYTEENSSIVESNVMPNLIKFGTWEQNLTGKKKDGSSIRCRVKLTLLETGGMFCICEDITEKEKIQEQERQDFIQKIIAIAEK